MAPNITNAQRAEILTQALPYIQKYNGKIVVVKYGGNAMTSEDLKQQVMEDIVLMSLIGVKIVLVHGGGPEITELLGKIGKKSELVDGLRVTDRETVDCANGARRENQQKPCQSSGNEGRQGHGNFRHRRTHDRIRGQR